MERVDYFDHAAEHTPLLAVDVNGHRILVETWDRTVARSLFIKHGRKEHRQLKRARRTLRQLGLPFRVFVDVGANIGTTSLAAVTLGAERVLAVEPAPGNYRLLMANIALNGLDDRVSAVNAAAGDREGTATLYLSPTNSGDHRLTDEHERDRVEVPLTTLPRILRRARLRARDVSLVWLDAQGSELDILRGAGRLLGVPLVFEYAPRLLADGLLDFVAGRYTHLQVLGGDAEPIPAREFTEPAALVDILALRL